MSQNQTLISGFQVSLVISAHFSHISYDAGCAVQGWQVGHCALTSEALALDSGHLDLNRSRPLMNTKGSVHQEIETREQVSMGSSLPVDCFGWLILGVDWACFWHVQWFVIGGIHGCCVCTGKTWVGAWNLGEFLGYVWWWYVEGWGGRVLPAILATSDASRVLFAASTGAARAVAKHSTLSTVVPLLWLKLKMIYNQFI